MVGVIATSPLSQSKLYNPWLLLQTLLRLKEGVHFLPQPALWLPRWNHRSGWGRSSFMCTVERARGAHLSHKGWRLQLSLFPFPIFWLLLVAFIFHEVRHGTWGPEAEGDPQRKEEPREPVGSDTPHLGRKYPLPRSIPSTSSVK